MFIYHPFFKSILSLTLTAASLSAAAIIPGTLTSTLPGTGDASAANVNIGFSVNWNGILYNQLSVNENGNITFGDSGYSDYSAASLAQTQRPIIAGFFADVDTSSHGQVSYGGATVDGRQAFAVNFLNVGYFGDSVFGANKSNDFQIILVNQGAGNFDLEFNFDRIQWESGLASGGINGLGGDSAIVGFSTTGTPAGVTFALAGSSVNGALLDSSVTSLVANSLNARDGVLGRYDFSVRNGIASSPVPEPYSALLLIFGFSVIGIIQRHTTKFRL